MIDSVPLAPPAAHPFIVMNPRSGNGKVQRFGLIDKAKRLGACVTLLEGGEALVDLMESAVAYGADLLGVAGGDGTLAAVAGVATAHHVPILVIPAGTRNHFALDLGLNRTHPDLALRALTAGIDVAVDLGDANGRPFVNTLSFGAYAEMVERPDYRDNKLRVSLRVLSEVLSSQETQRFTVRAGSVTVRDPTVALVSNNPYGGRHARGPARRPRLDTGELGLVCVEPPPEDPAALAIEGRLHAPTTVTGSSEIVVTAPTPTILAAIDGESVRLDAPVRCTLRHRALHVRVPARTHSRH